jgi:tRNA (guanine37-N1)-methyltransferase
MTNIHFHIITLFPEAIKPYLDSSIIGRAARRKIIAISLYQLRDFSNDKHKRVDGKPYAGGPGMVLQAKPILRAADKILKRIKRKRGRSIKTIIFSPAGKEFTNIHAMEFAKQYTDIVLIAGRYEGIDARVKKILHAEEMSIGPYVLTGGELPAAVVVDAVTRHITGVLGKDESVEERRLASPEVYTRPEVLSYKGKKYKVPSVLLSGNHKKIEEWKKKRLTT